MRVGRTSNAKIENSCYQHTRACPSGIDERGVRRWGLRLFPLV